jgi:FkbM family methyltransferase
MSVRLIFRSVWHNPGNHGHRLARLVRAAQWQLEKRLAHRTKTLRLSNGILFQAHPDCVISSALIYAEWPEFLELQFLRRLLRHGDAVVDVGANVGHISLLLGDIVGAENIFAFEPTPVSYRRLVENWKLNGWKTNQLFQSAVGRRMSRVLVQDTERPETKNSVLRGASADHCVEVPLVTLNASRAHWKGRHIGLLKVDVEGYEPEVFAGATELLREDRPRVLMFESLSGKVESEVAQVLSHVQYEVFQLDESGRPVFGRHDAQNLFAVPEELRDSLAAN